MVLVEKDVRQLTEELDYANEQISTMVETILELEARLTELEPEVTE